MVLRLRIDSEIIRFGRAAHQLDSARAQHVVGRIVCPADRWDLAPQGKDFPVMLGKLDGVGQQDVG